jgi:cytochrome P450
MTAIDSTNTRATDDAAAAYDPFDQQFLDDPHPVYDRIHNEAPVCWSDAFESWLVTRYDDVASAVNNPVFSSRNKSGPMPPAEVLEELEKGFPMTGMLYGTDPPEHTRLRALVQAAITAELVADFEQPLRATANQVVYRFFYEGEADLYERFVKPYTDFAILDFVGVPREEQPRVWSWHRTWESVFIPGSEPEDQRAGARQVVDYQNYYAAMIESRRAKPRDDLVSALTHAQAEGWEPLSTGEIVWELVELVGAAGNTTYGMANVLLRLLQDGPRWRTLSENPALVPAAVEEGMRVESPVLGCARETTEPVELGGVQLPEGAPVLIAFAAANHDGDAFDDAERFDPRRRGARPQVTLGRGPHYCVGARLAKLMIVVAAQVLGERIPTAHLPDGYVPEFYAPYPFLRSVAALPARWETEVTA